MKRYIRSSADFNNGRFDEYQIEQIEMGLDEGVDITQYADPRYNRWQMELIRQGLNDNLDVSWYADPRFDTQQMAAIQVGLLDGVDVSQYADPQYTADEMLEIKHKLEDEFYSNLQNIRATTDAFTKEQKQYVYRCVADSPSVPSSDDSEETWSQFWRDDKEYKTWCFVDAVEEGLFTDAEEDEFNRLWDEAETDMALPYA